MARSFLVRQAVEIPLAACGWQALVFGFAWTDGRLYEALAPLPPVIGTWVRLALLYFALGLVLVYGRYLLFERLYGAVPYTTPRTVPDRIDLFTRDRFVVSFGILAAGVWLLHDRPPLAPRWLTPVDHALLLGSWLATDAVYFVVHLVLHRRGPYRWVHAHHHRVVRRPNAYADPDRFTVVEGVWNFAVPVLVFHGVGLVVPLPSDLLLVAVVQWYLVGQLQHGGKDIPVNQLPGLELVRRLLGVRHSMCLQHDAHHLRMNHHFSMSGIYDRWWLPAHRRESPGRSVARTLGAADAR